MDFEKTSDIILVCKWLSEKLRSSNSSYRFVISSNGSDNWMQKCHPHAKLEVDLVDDMPFRPDEELVSVWSTDTNETLDHAMHRLANRFWSKFEDNFDLFARENSSGNVTAQACAIASSWGHVFKYISSREELELKLSIES